MSGRVMCVGIVALAIPLAVQAGGEYQIHTVTSDALGEDRRVAAYLPEGYTNTVNYDVNSVDNAEFLLDLSSGAPQYVPNPRFGQYLDTFAPREVQLGLRFVF